MSSETRSPTERHPAGARQVQAAGHFDNRTEVDPRCGSSRRTRGCCGGSASQHRIDGRAVLQVRLRAGRGGGPESRRPTRPGWWWRGWSFHVGSQCTNFENFVQAVSPMAAGRAAGGAVARLQLNIPRHRRGFPRALQPHVRPFSQLAKVINAEIDRYFRRAWNHRRAGPVLSWPRR